MTEEDQPTTNPDAASETADTGGPDPIRKITRIVLLVGAVYVGFYIAGDRLAPYTDQARVQALVTPIVPRVAGHLTAVDVRLHSVVEHGDRTVRANANKLTRLDGLVGTPLNHLAVQRSGKGPVPATRNDRLDSNFGPTTRIHTNGLRPKQGRAAAGGA